MSYVDHHANNARFALKARHLCPDPLPDHAIAAWDACGAWAATPPTPDEREAVYQAHCGVDWGEAHEQTPQALALAAALQVARGWGVTDFVVGALFQVRPVLQGELGRLLGAVGAFELGNVAATLLILRATDLLRPEHGADKAAQLALALYTAYNIAATLISVPAGRHGDRRRPVEASRPARSRLRAPTSSLHSPAPACSSSRPALSSPASASAASKPPNTPRSPHSRPSSSAAPHSVCSRPPRALAIRRQQRRRPALDPRLADRSVHLRRRLDAHRARRVH